MQDCLKDLQAKARIFYQQQDPYHNLKHGERVVRYALKINQSELGACRTYAFEHTLY